MIEKLIEYLEKINEGEIEIPTAFIRENEDFSDENTDTHYNANIQSKTIFNTESLPDELKELIIDLLIRDGKCNYENMKILKEKGFNVFPIESDSFGWLIGV